LTVGWNPRQHYKSIEIAAEYDRTRFNSLAGRTFSRLEKRALLRALSGLPDGSKILDIPCGTGRLVEELLEAGYRVTGVDISQDMLDEAKRKLTRFGDRFSGRLGDAVRIPAPETSFPLWYPLAY
jgi:ubiquinone/menaquinone biosynthesis C-methylase UbiE